ncbi:MAG: smc 2 [Capsulimonas sp.]|nr:smc 2 [Capsulimonas sp.]
MSHPFRKRATNKIHRTRTAAWVVAALAFPGALPPADAVTPPPADAPAAEAAATPPAPSDASIAGMVTETTKARDQYKIAALQLADAQLVIAAMPIADPKLGASSETIDRLGSAAEALTSIHATSAKNLTELNTALAAYAKATPAAALDAAAAIVTTDHKLSAEQQAKVDEAAALSKQIAALQAAINKDVIGEGDKTILLQSVAGVGEYAAALVGGLDGKLSALKTQNVSIYAADFQTSSPLILRDGLVTALKPVYEEERLRVHLAKQAGVFFKAAGGDASSEAYNTAAAALSAKATGLIDIIPIAATSISANLQEQTNALDVLTENVKAQLRKPAGERDIPPTSVNMSEARDSIAAARMIIEDWQPLKSFWEAQAAAKIRPADKAVSVMLNVKTQDASASASRLADILSGDVQNFVQDQVRLYYFTDVQRIIKALNPAADIFNKDALTGVALARQTRDALTKADSELAGKIAKINDLKSRKQAVVEEIRQANAIAAAQSRRATLAQAEYARIDKEEKATALRLDDTTLTPDQKAALTAQRTDLQTQLQEQAAQRDAAQAASEQAAADKRRLVGEQDTIPLKLQVADDELRRAQTDIATARRTNEILAQQASETFADSRDNAPYYFAPADVSSNDPAHRVIIFAYPDSKIIFLRGLQDDLDLVKELIAGFDKPAPQARITLWSMQLNGPSTKSMNKALFTIDDTLRDLRGNLTLIQDLLRDSVNAEVNRTERIMYEATHQAYKQLAHDNPDNDAETSQGIVDRMARYFYYPDEIRSALGFTTDIPDDIEHLATAKVDLELCREYFAKARYSQIAANELTDHTKKKQYEYGREQSLRRSGLHLQHALASLNFCPQQRPYLSKILTVDGGAFQCSALLDRFVAKSNEIAGLIHRQAWSDDHSNDCNYDDLFELKEGKRDDATHQQQTAQLPSRETQIERQFDELNWALQCRLGVMDANNPDGLYADAATGGSIPSDRYDVSILPFGRALDSVNRLTRLTIPDPARGTTLGEILFELSLGKRRSRENILRSFLLELNDAYYSSNSGKLAIERSQKRKYQSNLQRFINDFGAQYGDEQVLGTGLHTDSAHDGYPFFPRTIFGALATRVPAEDNNHEMTSNQLEIFSALQVKVRSAAAMEVRRLLRQISDSRENEGAAPETGQVEAEQFLRAQYLPLVGWLNAKQIGPRASSSAQPKSKLPARDDWFAQGWSVLMGGDMPSLDPSYQEFMRMDTATKNALDRKAWELTKLTWQRNALSAATPRVAAADDMIKRMIIVAEDDLDHYFVQPALQKVQSLTDNSDVQFGVIQRESLLCTNRLVARVDPSATANPTVPGDDNVLASAQQLGQIAAQYVEDQKAAKLNTTLPLAAGGISKVFAGASLATSFGVAGIIGLLGDLAAQPQKPKGEVYSINTGNVFQVTPVFDPSGQALRFKFDFVASTRLTEPDGTVNPQIPRVERHAVNTEVQLTNLEFREISRFQANTKVGVPPQTSGGIPGFNRLPIIKDIPILGYFTRRGRTDPTQQESLIFAQTSIYPTVGDIIGLLTDENPREDIDPREPAMLQKKNKTVDTPISVDDMKGRTESQPPTLIDHTPAPQAVDHAVLIPPVIRNIQKPKVKRYIPPKAQRMETFTK